MEITNDIILGAMILGIIVVIIFCFFIGWWLANRRIKKQQKNIPDNIEELIRKENKELQEAEQLRQQRQQQGIIKQFREEERKDGKTQKRSSNGLGGGIGRGDGGELGGRDRGELGREQRREIGVGDSEGRQRSPEADSSVRGIEGQDAIKSRVQVSSDTTDGTTKPDDEIEWPELDGTDGRDEPDDEIKWPELD